MVRAIAARYFRGLFWQEEAIQEIWIHVLHRRRALDTERLASFEGWLSTLARRRCIDLLRRQGKHRVEEEAPVREGETPPDPAERRELAEAVAAFKADLDAEAREVFELHLEQDLTYGEIEARTGRPAHRSKYVKKLLLDRARRHRQLLAALGRYHRRP